MPAAKRGEEFRARCQAQRWPSCPLPSEVRTFRLAAKRGEPRVWDEEPSLCRRSLGDRASPGRERPGLSTRPPAHTARGPRWGEAGSRPHPPRAGLAHSALE